MVNDSNPSPESEDPIDVAASNWLARRERGLTAAEQDEYLQWLAARPEHGRAMARMDRTWRAMDSLAEWKPQHSKHPNPDLLAVRRRRNRWPVTAALVLLAAVIAVVVYLGRIRSGPAAPDEVVAKKPSSVHVIPRPERLTLADGSSVDVNGARFETAFTPTERRVRLLEGEAHFTVTKNPARPFVVETAGVTVRAVGTAFSVARTTSAVAVLVTEGKVEVRRVPAGGPAETPVGVAAGQRAIVDIRSADAPPVVDEPSAAEIERSTAWRSVRLEFADVPLSAVVAEFNLRNQRQLVIADEATGQLLVGGSFRADNVDAFVRLLEKTFGISAQPRADGSVELRLIR